MLWRMPRSSDSSHPNTTTVSYTTTPNGEHSLTPLLLHTEIKRLMGCFLFAHKGLENSPYADLLNPWHWTEVADMFAKDACKLLGLSLESPLRVR